MTFKADRPVGRYYIVPNSLVVGYDKTIVFRDRHSNPVFTLPNGGKLLISDGHRAEPKVYTCRFIDQKVHTGASYMALTIVESSTSYLIERRTAVSSRG